MTTAELLAHLARLDVRLAADGDRLRVDAPGGALTSELVAELRARKAELLAVLAPSPSPPPPPSDTALGSIRPVPRTGPLPLSVAQRRLWFLARLEGESATYNMPAATALTGRLAVPALARALAEIVRRHEVLRTAFAEVGGEPVQVVAPPEEVELSLPPLPVVDLVALPSGRRSAERRRLAAAQGRRPFDLGRAPLFRALLVREGEASHALLWTVHHIVSDGWSTALFGRELATLLDAFSRGLPSPLPDLPVQYADFAGWQREWLAGEASREQLAYWRRQLAGAPTLLALPADRPRPTVASFRGATLPFALGGPLTAALRALQRRERTTLFVTLLAAFVALLHRRTGRDDLLVGIDVAGRTRAELEGLLGFFVNLLALRADASGNPSFRELLARVREAALAAYRHQDVPFDAVVEAVRPPRSLGHMPLVQVLFVFQNAPLQAIELPGLTLSPLPVEAPGSKFDLVLFMDDAAGGLTGAFNYSTDLFDPTTIERLSRDLAALLEQVAEQPDTRLSRLELPSLNVEGAPAMEAIERRTSKLDKLGAVRRRAVDLGQVSPVRFGDLAPGATLPLLAEPANPAVAAVAAVDLAGWARSERERIESHLVRHGAILFRGFGLPDVPAFEAVATALCPDLVGDYGDLPRADHGERVYKSTPYPPDRHILFHNESSHLHRWPTRQMFFCDLPAEAGGETPIVDCRRVYAALDPALRERFERLGLLYVRNFTPGLDVSWESFFGTGDRAAVERACREAGMDLEWKGDGGLCIRTRCPAVVRHPTTGEPSFFNQVQLHHASCLDPEDRRSLTALFGEADLPRNVLWGDGSPIADEVVAEVFRLTWDLAVAFPWQRGDLLLLDNMLVAHARNPYTGPRRIAVAMGAMTGVAELAEAAHVA